MSHFPPDLPDLLRLACSSGKLRLHVWFSAQNGHQANLANSGQGWTVDHSADPLEAIAKVLRQRYGRQLERQGECRPVYQQIDLEEAIAAAPPLTPADDIQGLIG